MLAVLLTQPAGSAPPDLLLRQRQFALGFGRWQRHQARPHLASRLSFPSLAESRSWLTLPWVLIPKPERPRLLYGATRLLSFFRSIIGACREMARTLETRQCLICGVQLPPGAPSVFLCQRRTRRIEAAGNHRRLDSGACCATIRTLIDIQDHEDGACFVVSTMMFASAHTLPLLAVKREDCLTGR